MGVQMGCLHGYGSCLFQKGSVFYFRKVLNSDQQRALGVGQLKKSLHVREIRNARKIVPFLEVAIQDFTVNYKKGLFSSMDQSQRKLILFKDLEEKINLWKKNHAEGKILSKDELNAKISEAKLLAEQVRNDRQTSNLKLFLKEVSDILSSYGVDVDSIDKNDAFDYSVYAETFHKYTYNALSGKQSVAESCLKKITPEACVQTLQVQNMEVNTGPLISDLLSKYIEENKGVWSKKSFANFDPTLRNSFLGNINDKPLSSFSRDDFNKLRDHLSKMDNSFRPGKPLSRQRVNGIIRTISAFFNWACKLGYMEVNYASNSSFRLPKGETDSRDIFEDSDLEKIFNHSTFKNPDLKKPLHFWIPILALYTGARQGELCYLKKEDVIDKKTHWIIDIHDKFHPKKTETSIRKIPLHSDLIKLGFIKFINSVKDNEFLFYTRDRKPRVAETVSKKFSIMKRELGFGDKKVFHSFRHTFANICKQQLKSGSEIMVKEIMGHAVSDMTFGHYSCKYDSEILFTEVISKLVFPVTLSELLSPGQAVESKRKRGRPRSPVKK